MDSLSTLFKGKNELGEILVPQSSPLWPKGNADFSILVLVGEATEDLDDVFVDLGINDAETFMGEVHIEDMCPVTMEWAPSYDLIRDRRLFAEYLADQKSKAIAKAYTMEELLKGVEDTGCVKITMTAETVHDLSRANLSLSREQIQHELEKVFPEGFTEEHDVAVLLIPSQSLILRAAQKGISVIPVYAPVNTSNAESADMVERIEGMCVAGLHVYAEDIDSGLALMDTLMNEFTSNPSPELLEANGQMRLGLGA